ncbi:15100_t:CDS:2 [Gigaspora rosea]|nr:15100_t:CDS:2 [Gigaspora rosea]
MGYKKKSSIVKNKIEKANRPKNFLDVGGSSTTVIDLPEIPFPEMEFPDIEIPDNSIQFDTVSSDNELIISSYEEEYNFITKTQFKKGKKSGKQGKRRVPLPIEFSKTFFSDDENDEAGLNENLLEEEEDLNDNEINFNAPNSYKENDNPTEPADTTNASMWIIFWALNYQAKCMLSNIETGFLIKFLRYLCIFHDKNKYTTFATTLKIACKALGICAQMIKYAICKKCCKLYSVADVSTNKPNLSPKIIQDFPNHPIANKRQPCTSYIAKKVPVTSGVIFKPTLIFLTISLVHQLQSLYNRKGFEVNCRKWVDRLVDPGMVTNIYDSRIWKTFQVL